MITHWDEVESNRRERGHIAASWQSLTGAQFDHRRRAAHLGRAGPVGDAAPSRGLGGGDLLRPLRQRRLGAVGRREGGGVRGRRRATASSTSRSSTRTRSAPGDDGLVVLAFGQRHYAANTLLPRAGVSWLGPTWVLQGAPDDHPWAREAAVGPPTLGRARRTAVTHRQRRRRARRHERTGATVAHARRATSGTPPAPSARGSPTTSCHPGS